MEQKKEDSKNKMETYHRRALIYLELNKYIEAIKDLLFLKKISTSYNFRCQNRKRKNDRKRRNCF